MIAIKNPDEPATSKQLWLLHKLTNTDTRSLNITMLEAHKRIVAAKKAKELKPSIEQNTIKVKVKKPAAKTTVTNEIEVVQGKQPENKTDMQKIQANFDKNAKPLAIEKLIKSNQLTDNVNIGFYEFNCEECLFGQTSICVPKWSEAGYCTCGNKVESVSFKCYHFEPTFYRPNCNCKRPKGKQCHRKHVENKCLHCAFRVSSALCLNSNRSEWYSYIPLIQDRINRYNDDIQRWLEPKQFYTDIDFSDSIQNHREIIELLNKLL